jgi:SAM-dependent methyltransferase
MIQAAKDLASTSGISNCTFAVENCATFSSPEASKVLNGTWDKVFSNAAYHWILHRPESRLDALRAAYTALRPGGTFVFECGGFGNAVEVVTALIASLTEYGVPLEKARELIPWYFASDIWMRDTLEGIGFRVDKMEIEYRPTKLTPKDDSGRGGLEGWIRLFGASIVDGLERSDDIIKHVCELLETATTREDGSQWLGYVRLRGVATKPNQ